MLALKKTSCVALSHFSYAYFLGLMAAIQKSLFAKSHKARKSVIQA